MNNRRKLVIALGAGALAAPFGSLAQQQGKVWRIGYLMQNDAAFSAPFIAAFNAGMRELGFFEGTDYTIEQRSAQDDNTRLPALAAELLALKVDLIVTTGTPSAVVASKATRDIPVLITTSGDPVGSGLVSSLRHPGGNVTGLANGVGSELYTKRLELLRELLPGIRRVGFLYDPDNGSDTAGLRQTKADCAKLGLQAIPAPLRKREEITAVFNALKRDKAQGLIVTASNTNQAWRDTIIELAAKHRLPAVYGQGIFAESGGLLSYSANWADQYRRSAAYAYKIFKGAKPGDLPIEQPSKFDAIINLKAVKALYLKIPNSILVQATKVIE